MACACDLISPEEYRELSQHWVEQAAAFHSWDEYAVGLVCGAAYWAFRMGGNQGAEDAAAYLDLNLRLVEQLLGSKQAWAGRMWRRPQGKAYKLSPPEMRALLQNWEGPDGCLATDHITVLGKKVGYCYREKPDSQYPDSGWRFFSGEETDEYANDVNNVGVYALNTICNYDPDILPPPHRPLRHRLRPGGRTGSSTPNPLRRRSPDPVGAAISRPPPVFFHTPL